MMTAMAGSGAPAAERERLLRRSIGGISAGGLTTVPTTTKLFFSASFAVGATAVWLFFCAALWRRGALDFSADYRGPPLTVATWVTVTRALGVSALAGFVLSPSVSSILEGAAAWIPG